MTQTEFAAGLGISYPRLNEIIHGKRGITPDTALRISALIGTTPQFWLNLQQAVDLWDAAHSTETKRALKKIERVKQTV
jgi:addiction module HigA family antidote